MADKEALKVTAEILLALSVLHKRGVIHRDIKMENILFRDNGDVVVIIDH